MSRLDVRVKTDLKARAFYRSGKKRLEKSVIFRDLSLTGAYTDNLTGPPDSIFTLKTEIPHGAEIELFSDVIRTDEKGGAAIRFFYSDTHTMTTLWKHIRESIRTQGCCPYCASPNGSKVHLCQRCGGYLDFKDDLYLQKHLKRTLYERILNRIEPLGSDNILKAIIYFDAAFLKTQGTDVDEEFVGTCPAMLQVFTMINKVSRTSMNVLILGESGTGKELTARAIHERSERHNNPFIPFNCAAIPEGLLEAELFGFQRGAFTGAYASKPGKFEMADKGTIFLDEIGDLSHKLQAKLLRFLEDHIVERIGAKKGRKVDVRILAATNSDIEKNIEAGKFRSDLYFRLNAFSITLPPLRERGEDRIVLARYFFEKLLGASPNHLRGFSDETVEAIRNYDWPGNVREMINKVRRGIVMANGEWIQPAEMELNGRSPSRISTGLQSISEARKQSLLDALEANNHVVVKTAKALGISRPTLYSLMKKAGIDRNRSRPLH